MKSEVEQRVDITLSTSYTYVGLFYFYQIIIEAINIFWVYVTLY